MSLEMYLGEVRDVEFTVTAQNNQPFTIRNPTYELTYGGKRGGRRSSRNGG